MLLYSPRIFKAAGIIDKNKLLLATIGIGLTKTLFMLIATCLLDKVGRRPLLLISTGGMVLALVGLGCWLDHDEPLQRKAFIGNEPKYCCYFHICGIAFFRAWACDMGL